MFTAQKYKFYDINITFIAKMIVGPLKSNIQLSIIILLAISVCLWGSHVAFLNPTIQGGKGTEHLLFRFFFDNSLSFIIKQLIALFIILIGAFFVNYLAIHQEIISKSNYLPFFFYSLFAFLATTKNTIEPILVANLFVVPALFFLMSSYRLERALSPLFNAGLCMGIASFFCMGYVLVFPLLFVALFILRPFDWREVGVVLIGLSVPAYLYMCVCYLSNQPVFTLFYALKQAMLPLQKPIVSEFYSVFLMVTLLLCALALFFYVNKGFGAKVKTQKAKSILVWMLVLCGCMAFFEHVPDMVLVPTMIPLSVIIGDYLAELKPLKIANVLLVLFVGGFLMVYFHAIGMI